MTQDQIYLFVLYRVSLRVYSVSIQICWKGLDLVDLPLHISSLLKDVCCQLHLRHEIPRNPGIFCSLEEVVAVVVVATSSDSLFS